VTKSQSTAASADKQSAAIKIEKANCRFHKPQIKKLSITNYNISSASSFQQNAPNAIIFPCLLLFATIYGYGEVDNLPRFCRENIALQQQQASAYN
jgi:hypothetical protein